MNAILKDKNTETFPLIGKVDLLLAYFKLLTLQCK